MLVHAQPVGLAARLDFHVRAELVDLLAGERAAGDRHRLDDLTNERLKAGILHHIGNVRHGEINAQIGLIGAVLVHRFHIRDAAERRLGGDIVGAVLCEDRRQHVLKHREHVLLRGERHLHIELVELAGRAVAAGVLVAEAGGDLEILIKAARHQQLLELLRCLRQSVELAGVLAGGDEIVARALGGRGSEDRRRNLEEAVIHHRAAQRRDDVAAQDDVVLDGGVAQIEIAVLESRALVGLTAAVDLKRQLVVAAAAEDLDLLGHDLDLAGGELGVGALAQADRAGDGDGALLVDALDGLHHLGGIDDDLRRAVKIAQDDEREVTADLADILHPAGQRYGFARVGGAELPAGVGTVL